MQRGATVLIACLVLLGSGVIPGAAVAPASATSGTTVANDAVGEPADADVSTPDSERAASIDRDDPRGSVTIQSVETVPKQPYVGQSVRFKVTLKNDGPVPVKIRNIAILPKDQNGGYVPDREYARIGDLQVLQPGETKTIRFDQQQDDRKIKKWGITRLRANVTVTTRDPEADHNTTVSDSKLFSIEVKRPPERPTVSIRGRDLVATESGEVVVDITNRADIPLENLELRLGGDVEVKNPQRLVPSVAAGESRTVVFNVSAQEAGDKQVGVQMKYDLYDGKQGQVSKQATITFKKPDSGPDPANVVLSQPDTEMEDGKIHITGQLGNKGGLPANGVTIEVVDSEGVTPVQPSPSHFVEGGIPPDETKGFDLYANVSPDVSTIQLRITYSSDGEQKEKVVDVAPPEITTAPTDDEKSDSDSGGGMGSLLGGLVVVAVLGMIGYAWRNSDDDDEAPVSPDTGDGPPVAADSSTTAAQGKPVQGQTGAGAAQQPQTANQPQTPSQPQGQPQTPNQPQRAHGQQPQTPNQPQGQPQGTPNQPQGQPQGTPNQPQGQPQGTPNQPQGQPQGPGGAAPSGSEVRCDGCGQPYPPAQLGTIALTEGQSAQTCQDCQSRALAAAKTELGAEAASDNEVVDELVSAMSDHPTCDGCGEAVPEADLQEMTLPDGSSAVSCSSCRRSALEAARREISRDDG